MLQTVQKIGPVLDLFTADHPEWGVSEVAENIGVPRSSAHALLSSLVETGLLQCRSRGRYRLGWRVVELNEALRASVDIRSVVAPTLARLSASLGETVHLGVLERGQVLYLDKIEGTHQIHVTGARVGSYLDAHCTALGKTLLAFREASEVQHLLRARPPRRRTEETITDPAGLLDHLRLIRAGGHAVDHGESLADVHCVAAPVRDDLGSVIAAISITVPATRFQLRRLELRDAVVAAAREASARLASAPGAASEASDAPAIAAV